MGYKTLSKLSRLAIIAFIIVAIYKGNNLRISNFFNNILYTEEKSITDAEASSKPSPVAKQKTPNVNSGSFVGKKISDIFDHLMDNPKFYGLVETVLKESAEKQGAIIENDPAFKPIIAKELNSGDGVKAECGDYVKINYKIVKAEKANELETKTKQIATLNLGDRKNKIHLGVQNSVIGHRKDSTLRSVFFEDLSKRTISEIKEKKSSQALAAEIDIISIDKKHPNSGLIIHYTRNAKPGSELPLCGQSNSFSYKVLSIDGKVLYESNNSNRLENIEINNSIPKELISAMLASPMEDFNATIIGTRSNIINSFKNPNVFDLRKINCPDNQVLMINLSSFKNS